MILKLKVEVWIQVVVATFRSGNFVLYNFCILIFFGVRSTSSTN